MRGLWGVTRLDPCCIMRAMTCKRCVLGKVVQPYTVDGSHSVQERIVGKMQRNKGANGEREILKWFSITFDLPVLNRNLEQTREGGADCLELPGITLEVKRQEQLCIPAWWRQTTRQAINHGGMPVLAYRQNHKPWIFCLPASLIIPHSWGYITLTKDEFIAWYKNKLLTLKL